MTGAQDTGRHRALEQARTSRPRISDADVEAVLDRIDACGIVDLVEPWVDRRLGRRRTLTPRALLAGMFLAADRNDGRVTLTAVTDLLHHQISPGARARLGIKAVPDTDKGFEAAYAVVRRLFHAVIAACDPSALPKNHRLDREHAARLTAAADHEQLRRNRARLIVLCNLIVEDSLAPVRDDLAEHWDGSGAVDGTCVCAYSKGTRTKGPITATDPDAAWHVRGGDHADPDASGQAAPSGTKSKKHRRGDFKFGYEATLVIGRSVPDAEPHRWPNPPIPPALVMGFVLDIPGREPGPNAIRALGDIRRRGHRAGWMSSDRAYNNSVPEEYQLPLAALGYRAVFDYTVDDYGIQDHTQGAIMVEGAWYCPSMPTALIEASAELAAESIDKATWRRRIDARAAYRLYPKQHPDPDGRSRLMCPAVAGKVICPLKKSCSQVNGGTRPPVVDPEPSPAGMAPKVCRQESITVSAATGAKHGQDLAFGSADWVRVYFSGRNSVEAFNGYAKDSLYEDLEDGRSRRIRGIAAASLLVAFQLAHANTRKIASWLRTRPKDGEPPQRRPSARQPKKPPELWTPAGYLAPDELAA